MSDKIFNENSLREEIVGVWGEYGAHVEVYDMLLKKLNELQTPPPDAAVREAVKHLKWHLTGRYMGRHHERHMEVLLRAVQSPRLTKEQVEAVKRAVNKLEQHAVGYALKYSETKAVHPEADELRAAFPEAFAGEVGRG